MLKAEGREWAKAWSGSLGCSLGGLWGQAVEGLTAGGWVWLGEEKEGAGATRDRAPLRFRWAVRAVSPSPVLGQVCEAVCNLARDCRLLSTCCGRASRIMMAI